MNRILSVALLTLTLPWGSASAATLLGPGAYLSTADSPLAGLSGYSYFHLEDFEDGLFNTPGVSVNSGTTVANPGIYTDSVDGDDGVIDGYGQAGYTHFNGSGTVGLTYTFNELVLGNLPTHAGIVWTDGLDSVLFQAFDAFGALLGSIGPANISDGNGVWSGETGEDHFFGIISDVGIGSIRITGGGGAGIEVDHLQYGAMAGSPVPVPGTLALVGLLAAQVMRRRTQRRNDTTPPADTRFTPR